jgi:GNAT superfamily N-acetyltransferase
MIAELTAAQIELPEFENLGDEFFKEAGFSHRFDPATFRANWSKLINNGIGHILGKFSGQTLVAVLGFVLAPDLNDGKLTAYETFWFSDHAHRGEGFGLLRAYEKRAAELGAGRVCMVHLHNLTPERLQEIYERRGFRKIEVHYMKEL